MNLRVLSYVLTVEEPLGRLDCRERDDEQEREGEREQTLQIHYKLYYGAGLLVVCSARGQKQ